MMHPRHRRGPLRLAPAGPSPTGPANASSTPPAPLSSPSEERHEVAAATAGELIACVNLPAFPLQCVLRDHPDWKEDPVVVVENDRPTSRILWANRAARALRITYGTRFSQAQSLASRLKAQVVTSERIQAASESIFRNLLLDSPAVEPVAKWPGFFWIDPNGLTNLYGPPTSWVGRVGTRLTEDAWVPAIVVGWERHHAFVISRSRTGPHVLPNREAERSLAFATPLTHLDLPSSLRDPLRKLDVRTVGEFARLPLEGLRVRWGAAAGELHELVTGRAWQPFHPQLPPVPAETTVPVDPPDDDHNRLLFGLKGPLHALASEREKRSEGIVAVELTFRLDHAPAHTERIETAEPTLDVLRLLDLIRLRLAGLDLAAPVEEMHLRLATREVHPAQLALLKAKPKRDPIAAANALARVRAAFGDESLRRAEPASNPLPEGRFRWVPFGELPALEPAAGEESDSAAGSPFPLVRSLLSRPTPLPDLPAHERERWLGPRGAVTHMLGPDRIATGWWKEPARRDYYFVETKTGEVLWIFLDRVSRRWFLHGIVD